RRRLHACPCSGLRPPARRAHPCPRLASRPLAVLARPRAVRPCQAPRRQADARRRVGWTQDVSWDELDRFGHEGEHEYHEGGERGESASRVERAPVVVGGRVTEREEYGEDDCPQEPARISADTEPDEEGDEQRGDPRSGPAERRI